MSSPLSLPSDAHVGPVYDDRTGRARFSRHELAAVLEHYDIGAVERIAVCSLGSGKAPKVKLSAERGEYFLKRRAPGRDDATRVAFCHALQRQLADWGYPVPRLIPTRQGGYTALRIDAHTYELFDYVDGTRPDRSIGAAARAGAALGHLHRLLRDWTPPIAPPRGAYHGSDDVARRLTLARRAIRRVEPDADRDALRELTAFLGDAYDDAADRVDELGYGDWAKSLLHGDWHPGNLMYRGGNVVGVLDFDSARLEPRMSDVANGALQFSIRMSEADRPLGWPPGFDIRRIEVFLREYDSTSGERLTARERRSLPWLITEALIVESVVPIAATGRFSHVRGSHFLGMVRDKIQWLRPRAAKLVRYLESEG